MEPCYDALGSVRRGGEKAPADGEASRSYRTLDSRTMHITRPH